MNAIRIVRRVAPLVLLLSVAGLALRRGQRTETPVHASGLSDLFRNPPVPAPSRLELEMRSAFGEDGPRYLRLAGELPELWAILNSPDRLRAARELARLHGTEPALDYLVHLVRADLGEEDEKTVLDTARSLPSRSFLLAALAPEMTLYLGLDEEAVWKILGREGVPREIHAALFEALLAAPPGRLRDFLRWAAENDRQERLLAACGTIPSDDLAFLSRLALLEQTEEAAAFLLSARDALPGLSADDRAGLAELLRRNPDHVPCAAALLNGLRETDSPRATLLQIGLLRSYLRFDTATLVLAAVFRGSGKFNDILARGHFLAIPLIAAEVEIDEEGGVRSIQKAERELDLIHDRGDLYLGDYEIGADGNVQVRASTLVREMVPGGDAYQVAKLLLNGKSPRIAEAIFALLDGGCLFVDLFTLGGASASKNAAKAAAKGAMIAAKTVRLGRLRRLVGRSAVLRRLLSAASVPASASRLASQFLDVLGIRPGTFSFHLAFGQLAYSALTRKRTVNVGKLNRDLARLADEIRRRKEVSE